MHLDDLDHAVLQLLSKDGRLSSRAVGEKLGIKTSMAQRRVHSLERRGVIQRYMPDVDPAAVGFEVTMFVRASPRDKTDLDAIPARLSTIPEIEACYVTSGHDNFLLLVHAPTLRSTKALLTRIEREAEVTTHVTMVLSKESPQPKASPPGAPRQGRRPTEYVHATPSAVRPGRPTSRRNG